MRIEIKPTAYNILPGETPLIHILRARGIEDVEHYLNVSDDDILDPLLLDNMDIGAKLLLNHIENKTKTYIQVDSDCDGYTSSAILLNYLYKVWPDFVENCVSYGLHDDKSHGLDLDTLPEDTKFIIIPDAGSNELEKHADLKNKGIDILILDHHLSDNITTDAVLINNQTCNYPTKSLCGAAIVYKFCSYLDVLINKQLADNYLDLAAIGLVADVMDLRDFETHRLIQKGLQNIFNPFLQEMLIKNSYSLKGDLNPFKVSFYIAPAVNAVTRMGTLEEKLTLFKSLLEYEAKKEVKSTKRGSAWGDTERIVDQAMRICTNVRSRQNKERDSQFEIISKQIENDNLTKNKILAVKLNDDKDDNKELTGLIANKLMSLYQQPILLLHKVFKDGKQYWMGSGRNGSSNGLSDFRKFLIESNLIDFAEGHENAFGFSILDEQFDNLIEYGNDKLSNIEFAPTYKVDIILDTKKNNYYDIIDLASYNDIWGEGLEKPLVLIKGIRIGEDTIEERNGGTLIIKLPDGVECVKFKVPQEEINNLKPKNNIYKTIDIVGSCDINDYNNKPQIVISDYEIAKTGYVF